MASCEQVSRLLPRLYEDDYYFFVHKPAGLAVRSPIRGIPCGVVEALELLGDEYDIKELQPCYSLDKRISGVLALAKTSEAADRFSKLVESGSIRRRFVAVVKGRMKPPPDPRSRRAAGPPAKRKKTTEPRSLQIEVLRQGSARATIRCSDRGQSAGRLRAQLSAADAHVLGDVRFEQGRLRPQAGRLFLHLEEIEFLHPLTNRRTSVRAPAPRSFDAVARGHDPLGEHLQTALAARLPLLFDEKTDAFRLINGRADGVSGLLADLLGEVVVLQTLQGKFQGGAPALHDAAAWFHKTLGVRAVYHKMIPRSRSRPSDADRKGLSDPTPISGEPVESEIVIREDGIRFIVRPYDGFATGFFVDHREKRRQLRALARGKRVLNTFAHTCGFSVAAAMGGASATASVDASRKSLEWGKRNFAANDISLTPHAFYCSDVFDYYKRAERQGHRYDLIILDPPTFARTGKKGKVFQVARDIKPLISGALKLLEPKGVVMLSVNQRGLTSRWLREQVAEAAGPRRFKVHDPLPAPIDFPGHDNEAIAVVIHFST